MAKIVVIENDKHILDEIVAFLEINKYEVIGAKNGRLGLEAIKTHIPDLIMCNLVMPDIDGHQIMIEVRSEPILALIPILFLIKVTDDISDYEDINLTIEDYVTKPIANQTLLDAVQKRLNKKSILDSQMKTLINILNLVFSQDREKLLLKSRMVALFSHDFRNPLASILASSNILRLYENRLSPERKARHFDQIDLSVKLLIQMLDDMLTVAELDNTQLEFDPEMMDIAKFVDTIVAEFRLIDGEHHHLIVQTAVPNLIQADPKIIRQILANLISNAIKYAPTGSEIKISASLNETEDNIILSVKDQGMGIPEDNLPYVFEGFYRASNVDNIKGSGLGLSIVKECVERHHGTIEVMSKMNTGTEFVIEIPLIKV